MSGGRNLIELTPGGSALWVPARSAPPPSGSRREAGAVLRGFARAFAGAVLFAMPLLMTMELWRIAVAVERWRLALLVVATVALVVGLSRTFGAVSGGVRWSAAVVDAGVALLAGTFAATVILTVLSVVDPVRSPSVAVSVIGLLMLPAAVGASYARGQLGQGGGSSEVSGYVHQLFLMTAGAVVFASNIAPTEEVVLLAAKMSDLQALLLVLLSLGLMHGFVYGAGFAGGEADGGLRSAMTLTVPGYAIALAVSAFLLWTFGRFDDTALLAATVESVVLALPASIGAAAARLIL